MFPLALSLAVCTSSGLGCVGGSCVVLACREACYYDVRGGSENKHGKANILLQVRVLLRLAGSQWPVTCVGTEALYPQS